MHKLRNILLQLAAYTLFAGVVGYFSVKPEYIHLDPGMALIKMNFTHAGEKKEECHTLSQEELEALAPNMRRPVICERERVPLLLEVMLDEKLVYREELQPTGLSRDGAATVYKKFPVSAGEHTLILQLRDSRRESGFDYVRNEKIMLAPGQNFVVDFRKEADGFIFL